MTTDSNIISKLTKGLKLKINKKKKSNWKTLKSSDSLPPTPTDEYMLYSDTEAELYNAKINVQANRSFCHTSNKENNENINTNNILSGLNSSNGISRSKTYNNRTTTTTYNNRTTFGVTQQSYQQNKNIYPTSSVTGSRKNSFQTLYASSPQNPNNLINSTTQPIPIHLTSSTCSTQSTPIHSINSPISSDSSETVVNEIKGNSKNPFMIMDNTTNTTTINPKTTISQINHLTVNTTNMDPALTHSLISPIEFDGAGNEIKNSSTTFKSTTIQPASSSITVNKPSSKSTPSNQTTKQNNTTEPLRSKSIKRIKPLITFDKPPMVSPMTTESDSDECVRGRKRSSKKSKKYSKKRSSLLAIKTSDLKETNRKREASMPTVGTKKSSYTYNKYSSEPASAIAARANIRLQSPNSPCNEEDDDVPLGIIQYKCLSTLLKESAPTNISSLQSNTKSSYKTHIKDNYGYVSPPPMDDKYDFSKYTTYTNYYQENYVI